MLSALLRGLLRPMMQCNVTNGTAFVGVLATVDDGKGSVTSLELCGASRFENG